MLDPAKIGRLGELNHPPERNHRICKRDEGWFFSTREDRLAGPFPSRSAAQKNAEDYVRFSMVYSKDVLHRLLDNFSTAPEQQAAPMGLTA